MRAMAYEDHGLSHLLASRHRYRSPVKPGGTTGQCGETLILHGVVHTAQYQFPAVLQRYAHTIDGYTVEIIDSTIYRVNHPEIIGRSRATISFLPQNGTFRKRRQKHIRNQLLTFFIQAQFDIMQQGFIHLLCVVKLIA